MYLRDFQIYADENLVDSFKGGFVQRFHRESTCVTELYNSLLNRTIKTDSIYRTIFIFSDARSMDTSTQLKAADQSDVQGVCEVKWPFNFVQYVELSNPQGKRDSIEDAFICAVDELFERRKWNREAWQRIKAEAHEQGSLFKGISKVSWPHRNRTYRVRVGFEWSLSFIDLYAILFPIRGKSEIARLHLFREIPIDGVLNGLLLKNNGEWTSETSFRFASGSFRKKSKTVDFGAFM